VKLFKSLIAIAYAILVINLKFANAAPIFVTTGQLVTGTTTPITLTAANISPNTGATGQTTLSNSGANLVVTFGSGANSTAGDFFMTWSGAGDGLNFSTATFKYLQIDIASVSPGMTNSNWQMFWADTDSTIGGGSNSGVNIGGGAVNAGQATPFSLVIDLVNGTSSGATGWGPGTLTSFRLDPFQGTPNNGQTFTISGITFGSELTPIPEPSSLTLLGVGLVGFIGVRRLRRSPA